MRICKRDRGIRHRDNSGRWMSANNDSQSAVERGASGGRETSISFGVAIYCAYLFGSCSFTWTIIVLWRIVKHYLCEYVQLHVVIKVDSNHILSLIKLFQSYCLSLYGSCLWPITCPSLLGFEVAFHKFLHIKFCILPWRYSNWCCAFCCQPTYFI